MKVSEEKRVLRRRAWTRFALRREAESMQDWRRWAKKVELGRTERSRRCLEKTRDALLPIPSFETDIHPPFPLPSGNDYDTIKRIKQGSAPFLRSSSGEALHQTGGLRQIAKGFAMEGPDGPGPVQNYKSESDPTCEKEIGLDQQIGLGRISS